MTTWSDESTELLRRLWADGLTASRIAIRLGHGTTRNMVIGRARRLKLARRAPSPSITRKLTEQEKLAHRMVRHQEQLARRRARHIAKRLAAGAVPRVRSTPPRPVAAPVVSTVYAGPPLSIVEVGPNQCRYAVTERSPHLFCSAPAVGSWCREHEAIVWIRR